MMRPYNNMKRTFILILLYTLISRFWRIGELPPMTSNSFLIYRYMSAAASCFTIFLIGTLAYRLTKKHRGALLAAWLFAVSPWAIEQGRVASLTNCLLPLWLGMWVVVFFMQSRIWKHIATGVLLVATFVLYCWIWLIQQDASVASMSAWIPQFFSILSPEMLFISNSTFWWGGVREFGMVFITLTPFIFLGFVHLLRIGFWVPIAILIGGAAITALAPGFPEGRQFYVVFPFLCFIAADGMYWGMYRCARRQVWIVVSIVLFLWYESVQFWHFYTIHYPLHVRENIGKIIGAF